MKPVILVSRANDPSGAWSEWCPVWLAQEYENAWRIWSWRNPFTRLVHKRALGERVEAR